jgi:hypothetical protein
VGVVEVVLDSEVLATIAEAGLRSPWVDIAGRKEQEKRRERQEGGEERRRARQDERMGE